MVYHVFGSYPQKYQPYNIRLVEGLRQKIQIKVISLSKLPKKNQLNHVYYKDSNFYKPSFNKLFKALRSRKKSLKEAYKFQSRFDYVIDNPDAVFHFHNLQNINDQLLDYMIINQIKYVISLRGFDVTIFPLLSKNNKNKLSKILKHAWRVHSVCKSLLGDAANYCEGVSDKSHVIYRTPNLKDVFDFQPRKKLEGEINIFTLSRIHWKKCVAESLISLKALLDKGHNVKYHIIGDFQGDEENRVIFLIHKLKLQDHVFLYGYKNEVEYKTIIQKMDFCWLPTINEGLPNTLYFLLRSGIPCIASETDGIPEVITNYENGILFEPYDFLDLTNKTHELINGNKIRLKIANNAKDTSLQNINNEMLKYINLYND